MKPKSVVIVVANPAVSTTLGWPVGFWASELIHPYDALVQAGHRVTITSPDGGKVELDAFSDPRDPSGYSKEDTLSLRYLNDANFVPLLDDTATISALNADEFDAILVAGGQAPMFTFHGKRMTGFANSEEDFADSVVGRKVMPFRIEDEAGKLGALFETKSAFTPFAVRDGHLITGQQQHSGGEVATLLLASLAA